MTPRQFQRLEQRYRLTGAVGLRHHGRGWPSPRRLPAALCAQVQALLRDRYAGFNDTHLTEKLTEQHGLALYGDGVNILVRTDAHWSLAEQLAGTQNPTHVGRMLHEFGIGYVQTRSPQGKGRIERLWETLQDRLVSEPRLRGIDTCADANAFLPEFRADLTAAPRASPPPPRRCGVARPAIWPSC